MKKIFIAALLLMGLLEAQAQVSFRPGLRAGANFSHFTQGDNYYNEYYSYDTQTYYDSYADFSSKVDFYAGIYGAVKFGKVYTLQPEVNYSRQGSKFEYTNDLGARVKGKTDVSYVSVSVINKFNFTKYFNIHLGPTIDAVVDHTRQRGAYGYYDYDSYQDIDSDIDLAFVAGIGIDFTKNIGLEARVKKGIIPVIDMSDNNHTNVVFSVGLNYTFDVK